MKLGVNIDHIASLRQLRRGKFPDPSFAALICEANGADSIVAHLREDRRHIQEYDLWSLKEVIRTRLNLEMSVAKEIVNIACELQPHQATLVPEKRQELTTEGGLDVAGNLLKVKKVVDRLSDSGIEVSLFIDPHKKQIAASLKAGARIVELHTGSYAGAQTLDSRKKFLNEIVAAKDYSLKNKLTVCAGHGLDYSNVSAVASIGGIEELNIGYSIICRAVTAGLNKAVKEMKSLIKEASGH